jgi:hypothetical protein
LHRAILLQRRAGWERLPIAPMSPTPSPAEEAAALGTMELLEQLRQDRLWLLRQLDSGRWSEWRLDLAALERELGQLLEQVGDRLGPS